MLVEQPSTFSKKSVSFVAAANVDLLSNFFNNTFENRILQTSKASNELRIEVLMLIVETLLMLDCSFKMSFHQTSEMTGCLGQLIIYVLRNHLPMTNL